MKEPKPELIEQVEMRPDAWEQFERAVKVVARAPAAPTLKDMVRKPKPSVVKQPRKR